MVPKTNIHDTFWRPDPNGGEVGLLEFIHRRGPNSRNHVLLQNRPLEELQRNFSPASNSEWNIDLSHNAFRLPKTALAVAQMQEAFGRGAGGSRSSQETIRVRPDDIQAAVVQNLETIQQEEYYLVRYRDYSPWAVEHYPDLVQQQSSWQAYMAGGGSGRYVEQCFAVHVGQSPGELIPLTESQLLFGVDILQRQLVQEMARLAPPSVSSHSSAPGMPSYAWGHSMNHLQNQHDVDFRALNEDQFNSLWGVLGEGFVKLGLEGDEVRRREEKARQEKEKHFREFVESGGGGDGMDGFYKPPAWYDWRPSAIQKRVRYRLNRAYRTVGQLAVQACVVGLAMVLLYRTIPGVPTLVSTLTAGVIGPRDGSAASHYHGRGATSSSGYQLKDRGLIASVLLGPKDLMDYLLAPADA